MLVASLPTFGRAQGYRQVAYDFRRLSRACHTRWPTALNVSATTVELALRTRSAPQEAIFFERLAEGQGAVAKAALVARKLFPTTAFLRANAVGAHRSRLGLFRAWLRHSVSLATHLGPAFVAWCRARRAISTSDARARQ